MRRRTRQATGRARGCAARRGAAVAVALTMVVAGCGDDGAATSTGVTGAPGTAEGGESAPPVSLEGSVDDRGSLDLGSSSELDLELGDSFFAPTFVGAQPGTTVTVTLRNEGDAAHTFTIDGTDVDEEIEPGGSATVEVALPDDGPFVYYCRFHVAGGMQGAFVLDGAGAGASSEAGEAGTTAPAASSGGFGY